VSIVSFSQSISVGYEPKSQSESTENLFALLYSTQFMNNSKPSQSKRQQEITRLSKDIKELAKQLNQLILEENQSNQTKQQDTQQVYLH
jgi:replicative DNA helicase